MKVVPASPQMGHDLHMSSIGERASTAAEPSLDPGRRSPIEQYTRIAMKPTAQLDIVRTASGATSYRLYHGRQLVWSTRAFSTKEGRDGARERLRQWLPSHPFKVVLAEYQEEVA